MEAFGQTFDEVEPRDAQGSVDDAELQGSVPSAFYSKLSLKIDLDSLPFSVSEVRKSINPVSGDCSNLLGELAIISQPATFIRLSLDDTHCQRKH